MAGPGGLLPSQRTSFVPGSAAVYPENHITKAKEGPLVDDRRNVKINNADRLMWYLTDKEHPMVVNAAVFLESPISLSSLVDRSEELCREYPIMACKVSADFRWTPCRFDPMEHTTTKVLGPDEDLQEYVGSQLSKGMDFDKPMWAWEVVSKPSTSEHLLMIRIHHVIGDGVALMTLLDHLLGREPNINTYKKYHMVPVCQTLTCGHPCYLDMVNSRWKQICGCFRLVTMVLFFPLLVLGIVFMIGDRRNPLQMKASHEKRVAWWSKDIPHAEVRQIGLSVKGTVNDTCCAIISGALHNYFKQTQTKKFRGCSLKCIIPVSVRGKKERYHLNNRVGALFVTLPVGASKPKRRLELCKYRMDVMKVSPAVPVAMIFIRLTTMCLGNEVCKRLQHIYTAKASLIFSNVMGSPTEASFLGSTVTGIMGFVPLPGRLGLGCTVTSYNGSIKFGFAADPVSLKDPELFARLIEEEFRVLKKLLGKNEEDEA